MPITPLRVWLAPFSSLNLPWNRLPYGTYLLKKACRTWVEVKVLKYNGNFKGLFSGLLKGGRFWRFEKNAGASGGVRNPFPEAAFPQTSQSACRACVFGRCALPAW